REVRPVGVAFLPAEVGECAVSLVEHADRIRHAGLPKHPFDQQGLPPVVLDEQDGGTGRGGYGRRGSSLFGHGHVFAVLGRSLLADIGPPWGPVEGWGPDASRPLA